MSVERERKALEKTYCGKMTVEGQKKTTVNGETVFTQGVLMEDAPCALSVGSLPATAQGDGGTIQYTATIFCAPEWEIPPGCRIIVTQWGRTAAYKYSGESALYPTHQQITVQREGMA